MSNLLPPKNKLALLKLYRKRYVSLAFFSLAALSVVAIVLLLPSYLYLRSSQIVLETEYDTLSSYETSTIAAQLAATVTDINGRLAAFPATSPASPLIAGMIDPILQVESPAIHIAEFDYAPGITSVQAKISVSGIADSRTDLLAFADKVRNIASFTSVDVPITNYIKDTDVPFTLTAVVALKPS